MVRISIKKVYVGPKRHVGMRPDYYIVTNHMGHKIKAGTKAEAEEIAAASRRVREKHKKE